MALTLEKEQRLERVGLIDYFSRHQGEWTAAAGDAYAYIKKGFDGAIVRIDDVVTPLKAVVAIDPDLRQFLDENKISQKYYLDYFTDLVLDRVWKTISR